MSEDIDGYGTVPDSMTDTRLSQQPAPAGTPLWPAVIELPRQAVVIFHDDGRLPRRSPVTALVEDGDGVGTGVATLPAAFHGRGHGIQWGHDAEALVLSQQADAALPLAAASCTDVFEVAWNPTAGRRRRAERGPFRSAARCGGGRDWPRRVGTWPGPVRIGSVTAKSAPPSGPPPRTCCRPCTTSATRPPG